MLTTLQDNPTHALFDPADPVGDWFVLHTRSRQEKVIAEALKAQGVGCFLPLVKKLRYYGRRKAKSIVPLFPGYVFMRGQRDDAFTVDRMNRIVQIIDVPDQSALAWQLRNIAKAVELDVPLGTYAYIKAGTPVVITAGPFKGLEGIVNDVVNDNRFVLQVDALAKGMCLEIDRDLLQPLDR